MSDNANAAIHFVDRHMAHGRSAMTVKSRALSSGYGSSW